MLKVHPPTGRFAIERLRPLPAWGNAGAIIALCLLVGLVYCNSLPAIWTIDDGSNILENPRVQIRDLSVSSLYGSMFLPPPPRRGRRPGVEPTPGAPELRSQLVFWADFADRVSCGEHRHPLPDGLHSLSGGTDTAPIAQHGRAF